MKHIQFLFSILLINSFLSAQTKNEFRGVWIATVMNIDWPPQKVGSDIQKADFIRQLDLHQTNGLNAVIVQVRPSGDAFYPSPYEPWSQWLTGTQGQAPSPFYDPMAFMIQEAHKRGMEFHAWLNPYRAEFTVGKSSIAAENMIRKHPDWFLTYGTTRYFNPANKQVQQFVIDVIKDIVRRYDIDAIHMDDYFYPYPIAGKTFPDDYAYQRSGSTLNKADWRRSNVDSMIRNINIAIKEIKPYVKFGISPFSVWRNLKDDTQGSDTKAGITNFDDLYADILLWMRKGWIDYVTPQLYREIYDPLIPFEKMVSWWAAHSFGRHVYIGHGIYRATENNNANWRLRSQLPDQIKLTRQTPGIQGSVFYSSKSFKNNPNGWNDSLQNNYYRMPAKIPTMPWLPQRPAWK
ncbi:MAG TPA: family 10 glycosylhydrolase [Niabella sp.]|nr:family 10 glycosylhydrolase [Niabella sp.]HOZ95905.1 family 10 glycosylhydrolase [Niabella sp.]HQW15817.1 family 10 glycosylhydrolase [Niabella sp.]HQX20957.1 family 10 glycosylhydrolase [Niabella sp.]HQX41253.1 family 10 glycosylhydrolase [Niabella sp.]